MTSKELETLLPIFEALVAGKEVQSYDPNADVWYPVKEYYPSIPTKYYRVKPETHARYAVAWDVDQYSECRFGYRTLRSAIIAREGASGAKGRIYAYESTDKFPVMNWREVTPGRDGGEV